LFVTNIGEPKEGRKDKIIDFLANLVPFTIESFYASFPNL
jgi:hypothetical protein